MSLLDLDNNFHSLGETFSSPCAPSPVAQPYWIKLNSALAEALNIDAQQLNSTAGLALLSGNQLHPSAQPVAATYAGHQFGHWNPQLGDGRATLLGELTGSDNRLYELQLKGSGRTPYSRGGDGRSPLGPVLREYILSEAMAALGVPSTRALAAVGTGEKVFREEALEGAILTRVARSHLRVGSFQFFAARENWSAVQTLADHVIERLYPELINADQPYLALLETVIEAQARLIAHWQSLGFIHGVMNTDNMLVSGETVDYGPCAFMESYHPNTVFSSIDHQGRYAYGNQPTIAQWNLSWLAQSLLKLIHRDESSAVELAQDALGRFVDQYQTAYQQRMANKLGFAQHSASTESLLTEFLEQLNTHKLDFTLSFRMLMEHLTDEADLTDSPSNQNRLREHFSLPDTLKPWLSHWQQALSASADSHENILARLQRNSPVFIARNHQVERVINAAYAGDFKPFHRLHDMLRSPCEFNPEHLNYALPAKPEEQVHRTFCGT